MTDQLKFILKKQDLKNAIVAGDIAMYDNIMATSGIDDQLKYYLVSEYGLSEIDKIGQDMILHIAIDPGLHHEIIEYTSLRGMSETFKKLFNIINFNELETKKILESMTKGCNLEVFQELNTIRKIPLKIQVAFACKPAVAVDIIESLIKENKDIPITASIIKKLLNDSSPVLSEIILERKFINSSVRKIKSPLLDTLFLARSLQENLEQKNIIKRQKI